MSCISTNCPRYHHCLKAYTADTAANDYMNMGSGGSSQEDTWMCGPLGDYALYEPAITTASSSSTTPVYNGPPSRVCAICESQDIEGADILSSEFWLCPDCMDTLKQIIRERKKDADIKNYVMKHHD